MGTCVGTGVRNRCASQGQKVGGQVWEQVSGTGVGTIVGNRCASQGQKVWEQVSGTGVGTGVGIGVGTTITTRFGTSGNRCHMS